jgi:hypothetical protein
LLSTRKATVSSALKLRYGPSEAASARHESNAIGTQKAHLQTKKNRISATFSTQRAGLSAFFCIFA